MQRPKWAYKEMTAAEPKKSSAIKWKKLRAAIYSQKSYNRVITIGIIFFFLFKKKKIKKKREIPTLPNMPSAVLLDRGCKNNIRKINDK